MLDHIKAFSQTVGGKCGYRCFVSTLLELRKIPNLVEKFVEHVGINALDVLNCCLDAVIASLNTSPKPALQLLKLIAAGGRVGNVNVFFNELWRDREVLAVRHSVVFDMLVKYYWDMRRGEEVYKCSYLMKDKGLVPNTETCNKMCGCRMQRCLG